MQGQVLTNKFYITIKLESYNTMVGITYGEYYEIPLLGQQEKNLNQYYKELNFNSVHISITLDKQVKTLTGL